MGTHEAATPPSTFLSDLWQKVRNEPVLITQFVAAAISLLAVFGLSLPVATAAAVMGFAQVVAALVARQKVAPLAKYSAVRADGHGKGVDPADPANDPVESVA